jgi:hypothetical protein
LLNSNAKQRGEKKGSVVLNFMPKENFECKDSYIKIKRVFSSSSTEFFACFPEDSQNSIHRVSRDDLISKLLKYGLEINFSDRYSLLQNRTHSFASKTPQQLLEYVESFVGNEDIVARIIQIVCKLFVFYFF